MAWYDKGKIPEWRTLIDRPYSLESLINSKDLILQQLPKVEELQGFLKTNRNNIITDLLQLCLKPPSDDSSYERKYGLPTKAIEMLTNQLFFTSLCIEKQQVRLFTEKTIEYFLAVDAHAQNINIYHGYFERLLRMLVGNRTVDKTELAVFLQQHQTKHGFIERLVKHFHKFSVCFALEMMLTLDFIEPLVTIAIQFKKNIVQIAFSYIASYAKEQNEPQKTQNSLQILKIFLQRSINFLIATRNQGESPLKMIKKDTIFGVYSIFQAHFSVLPKIITGNSEICIKIIVFQLLQLNQILISQPEMCLKGISSDWALTQCHSVISYMIGSKVSISHPAFIEWLNISFARVGQHETLIDLLSKMRVLQQTIGMMLDNRGNNILNAKIYQLLKLILHNAIEAEAMICIQRHKINPSANVQFKLLHLFLACLIPLQTAVRQFKSINEPLFVTLFTLFKAISQYFINIDKLLSIYTQQMNNCHALRAALGKVIEFQQKEQCFLVFQREIGKDLGKFYTDDMFLNQKPVQYTVKHPTLIQKIISNSTIQAQTLIKLPSPPTYQPIPLSNLPFLNQVPIASVQKHEIITVPVIKSQTIMPKNDSIQPFVPTQDQNQQESCQNQKRYDSFMRQRLRQVETNIQTRKSQSRTPTKIKNELKKAKNKWVTNQDEPQNAFSCEIKERTARSQPKMSKALMECKAMKVALIRIKRNQLPKQKKERYMLSPRDSRLLGWLTALRT